MPKLIFPSADEKAMLTAAGVSIRLLPVIGAAEIVFGIFTLLLWPWRPMLSINAALMLGALLGVALQSPSYLIAAFNPITLNIAMIALSAIGYLCANELPSAAHCLRYPLK